jgi:Protein kinase domain
MICPRCGNEWDANKSPCTRCGLVIRMPGQSGPMGRATPPHQQKSNSQQLGGSSTFRPQSSGSLDNFPSNNALSQPFTSSRGDAGTPNTPQPSFPSFQSGPTVRPNNPTPATGMPRSSAKSNSGFEHNMRKSVTPQAPSNFGNAATQVGGPRTDSLSPRSVPPRPQSASQMGRVADSYMPDVQRAQNAPRASRLVTDPLVHENQRAQPNQSFSPHQQNDAASTQSGNRASGTDTRSLQPGNILRGGRYRLHELQERQEWLSGVYESMWIAQDAQRGASQVMICELVLPENGSFVMQSTLRTATMALTSVGRHPHIPTLWDAFSDRGRNFFVFEPIQGESLLNRMRRTGRAMAEQDVIECCLQMTEVLELLAQQSPPLVHGLIRPEHILAARTGSQYVLTNFSIILAGGATQFVSGIDRSRLSPYAAPEFVRGVVDVRSDLYSMMATAYHAVTGSMPAGVSGSIPQARRLNPNVSPQFDAILGKALRPIASQRYQRPSELRQELLAIRSVSGSLVSGSGQRLDQPMFRSSDSVQHGQKFEPAAALQYSDSVAQTFQSLAPVEDEDEQRLLLPRPEELPPLVERNDMLHAAIWLGSILVCLVLVIIFSRGFF